MLLSIIIPVYNVESYMHQCINSVISQIDSDIEVILVDDGSTDSSGEICDEFAALDSRIKVIHKENGGLSDARNVGFDLGKGDFIWFIDSDDWISSTAISLVKKNILNSELEMLAFSAVDYFDTMAVFGEPYQLKKIDICDGNKFLAINGLMNPAAWNYIYSSNFLKKHNLKFIKGLIHEDDYFNLLAFDKVKKIKKIKEVLYYYRRRENSIFTSKPNSLRFNSLITLIDLCNSLLKSNLNYNFINNKLFNYISLTIILSLKSDCNSKEIRYRVKRIKKIVRFQKIILSDSKGIILEKIIYNISGYLYLLKKKYVDANR
jgi:glycosyltransferase involved in cell wall biosynthesis